MNKKIKRITLISILSAIAVVGSTFNIPIFGAQASPIQHIINIISGVFLGPIGAILVAIISSIIRNILGLGTLFAFPGSIFGAFMAGILYKKYNSLIMAYIGEIIGTSIIGAIVSFPIAKYILENNQVAIFTFVIPFFISSAFGTFLAIIILSIMNKSNILVKLKRDIK